VIRDSYGDRVSTPRDVPAPLDVARPMITPADAERAALELFGVRGSFVELGSQQDRNYRIDAADGVLLLKIANPGWAPLVLEAQNAAMEHLQSAALAVPRPLSALDGSHIAWLDHEGARLAVRLLSYVEGTPLNEAPYLAPSVVGTLGRLAGEVVRALETFDHPGIDRVLQWDLQHAEAVVEGFAVHLTDPAERARVEALAHAAASRLAEVRAELRRQAIHGDITDFNVVFARDRAGRPLPCGVIDFGDLSRGWLVGELAVTCAAVLSHMPQAPLGVLPAVRAFDELVPLSDAEIAALWPLIALRGAVLVVSDAQQVAADPENDYAADNLPVDRAMLEGAGALGFELAEAALRDALGRPHPGVALPVAGQLIAGLAERAPSLLDLSVTSELLDEGRFLEPDCEQQLFAEAAAARGVAIGRYGEHRLTRARTDGDGEAETFALGVEIVATHEQHPAAPWDATVGGVGADWLELVRDDVTLRLIGLEPSAALGAPVAAGDSLGVVSAGRHLGVQLCTVRDLSPPAFVTPAEAGAWVRLCPDPSAVLGVDCAALPIDPAGVLARRDAAFARVQGRYYEDPPQIERGFAEHLIDTTGRMYVDMVNNVALLGHAHPRLTRDVSRQWRLLNTNSRFNYEVVAEFTAQLAALAPDGLDTVLLVNSGTEAADLALRLAFAHTGREVVIAVGEAYHGWSVAADGVSTSLADNPNALETRPAWARFLDSPNSYRGRHRGPLESRRYATEATARVEEMVAAGDLPAAFICEAVYGNAGGVMLPPGYLRAVYQAVRACGGLCIADEVQVGYGRLGHHFFGFEEQGVVPDVITVAKAMGNGHPLGAVITRREIAESFSTVGSFFSSAGGSTVSCRVGLSVLEILRDENLQANAATVGDHFIERVRALGERYPLIGAVHGMGLYVGIELVRDRDTLEPALEETYAICERMRELGVIMQPTSDRMNTLKVKPPLCITRASADFVVDQLERVLAEGW
jgi:4-aminobutyrate aminotransferase-like enzyme/Ser/Thr protein kinase RdoA (MazF antagonist)